MKRALAFVLLFASFAVASPESDLAQAKTFFSAGASAYAKGRYEEAASQLEEAYRLAPKHQVLFSLAQAERKVFFSTGRPQARLRLAIEHYERYLKEPAATRREDATTALAELVPLMKTEASSADAPDATPKSDPAKTKVTFQTSVEVAKMSLDEGPFVEAPLITETTPGKHRVRVTADGYKDASLEISVEPGRRSAWEIPMREKPATLVFELNRSAEVYVDGRLVGRTGTSGSIEVPAGTVSVSLACNGAQLYNEEVVLQRGKEKKLKVRLHDSTQRTWSYISIVSGGVLLTGAALLALGAVGEQQRALDLLAERDKSALRAEQFANYERHADNRNTLRNGSVVALGIGSAVLATGVLTYIFDRPAPSLAPSRRSEEPERAKRLDVELTAAPWISPIVQGAQLTGTF
jgi:tetratricopeptide (TPR) repeat protein